MRTGILIQARLSSTRLPRKVLLPLGDSTVLGVLLRQISSFANSRNLPIIIASTSNPSDNDLESYCASQGINFFRGSEANVLSRFYHAAQLYSLDAIIRLTADCPLICPNQLAKLYDHFVDNQLDYTYFDLSFPEGICADIFTYKILEKAFLSATTQEELEHVTPYMHLHKVEYNIKHLALSTVNSNLRFTLDTHLDYSAILQLYSALSTSGAQPPYLMEQIIRTYSLHPRLSLVNSAVTRNASFNVFDI